MLLTVVPLKSKVTLMKRVSEVAQPFASLGHCLSSRLTGPLGISNWKDLMVAERVHGSE